MNGVSLGAAAEISSHADDFRNRSVEAPDHGVEFSTRLLRGFLPARFERVATFRGESRLQLSKLLPQARRFGVVPRTARMIAELIADAALHARAPNGRECHWLHTTGVRTPDDLRQHTVPRPCPSS